MTTDWPRTPTERRAARAQIVARIAAGGLTRAEARAINGGPGWTLAAPDGAAATWRWQRGEYAIIATLVERDGAAWGEGPPDAR